MEMAQVLKELQDAVIVLSELERRQSVFLGDHSEWLQEHDKRLIAHSEWLQEHDKRLIAHSEWLQEHDKRQIAHSERLQEHDKSMIAHQEWLEEMRGFQKRTEQNLAEITDKLNGLIGYMDGMKH